MEAETEVVRTISWNPKNDPNYITIVSEQQPGSKYNFKFSCFGKAIAETGFIAINTLGRCLQEWTGGNNQEVRMFEQDSKQTICVLTDMNKGIQVFKRTIHGKEREDVIMNQDPVPNLGFWHLFRSNDLMPDNLEWTKRLADDSAWTSEDLSGERGITRHSVKENTTIKTLHVMPTSSGAEIYIRQKSEVERREVNELICQVYNTNSKSFYSMPEKPVCDEMFNDPNISFDTKIDYLRHNYDYAEIGAGGFIRFYQNEVIYNFGGDLDLGSATPERIREVTVANLRIERDDEITVPDETSNISTEGDGVKFVEESNTKTFVKSKDVLLFDEANIKVFKERINFFRRNCGIHEAVRIRVDRNFLMKIGISLQEFLPAFLGIGTSEEEGTLLFEKAIDTDLLRDTILQHRDVTPEMIKKGYTEIEKVFRRCAWMDISISVDKKYAILATDQRVFIGYRIRKEITTERIAKVVEFGVSLFTNGRRILDCASTAQAVIEVLDNEGVGNATPDFLRNSVEKLDKGNKILHQIETAVKNSKKFTAQNENKMDDAEEKTV